MPGKLGAHFPFSFGTFSSFPSLLDQNSWAYLCDLEEPKAGHSSSFLPHGAAVSFSPLFPPEAHKSTFFCFFSFSRDPTQLTALAAWAFPFFFLSIS